jgi:hypothetical protein
LLLRNKDYTLMSLGLCSEPGMFRDVADGDRRAQTL